MTSTTFPTSAGNDDSRSAPHLTCYFKTHDNNDIDASTKTTSGKALLHQESGKKSSFLLQPKHEKSSLDTDVKESVHWYSVPRPAQLLVVHDNLRTATNEPSKGSFFFGGLQLVFDAKNIEIYLTSPEGKESYLMTCKGIPYKLSGKENISQESESTSSQKTDWRRALCVVPGGPRCISSLRVKLIGLTSTPDSSTTKVQFLKLTARLVNTSSPATRPPTSRPPSASADPQGMKTNPLSFNPNMFAPATTTMDTSTSEPPLTQKDLGAAMAGLSFIARQTEENMANLFKEQSKQIEDRVEAYLTRMELQMRALKPTLAMQLQLIKENQTIMREQQQIMDCQSAQINKLLSDNQDLQVRVQSLQADISILRSNNTGEVNSRSSGAEIANTNACAAGGASDPMLTAERSLSTEQVAENSPSVDLVNAKKNIEKENARLRNIIQNFAQGIDEGPLGGCGADRPPFNTLSADDKYSSYGALGMDEKDAELENIRLRNAIRNIERGMEEPLIGCGVTNAAKYPDPQENAVMNTENKVVAVQRFKQVDEIAIDSGCGYLLKGLEGGRTGKIDSAIASRIKPSAISIDATRSLENIKKKYSDEYAHTPTIEVELLHQEEKKEKDKKKGGNDESKVLSADV